MRWLKVELKRSRMRSLFNHCTGRKGKINVDKLHHVMFEICRMTKEKLLAVLADIGCLPDSSDNVDYNKFIDQMVGTDDLEIPRTMNFNPTHWKEEARKGMDRAGIHPKFLTDQHWAEIWEKHFDRIGSTTASNFDNVLQPNFPVERNLRILQWNLLAEGLVPEGFLSPLVTKDHVDRMQKHLAKKVEAQQDINTLHETATMVIKGDRNIVWKQIDDDGQYVEFAKMAYDTVLSMKGQPDDKKKKEGIKLGQIYNSSKAHIPEQLKSNEEALTQIEHRLQRVLWFVGLTEPDIITFQELDNFEVLRTELEKVGYSCSAEPGLEYTRLGDRVCQDTSLPFGEQYEAKVNQSKFSFAPKSDSKAASEGKSNARRFLEPRGKGPIFGKSWGVDDDGIAIFWRSDRFKLVGKPEFCIMPGEKDVNAFLKGENTADTCTKDSGDCSAVRVRLEIIEPDSTCEGQQFLVSSTHLSSGNETKKEQRRVLETKALWKASDLPEIWAMDANTDYQYKPVEVPKCAKNNAIRSFMQDRQLENVWDTYYVDGSKGAVENTPISVWKMRGSASAQPAKVGEDQYQLIDHIFFSGKELFSRGKLALPLRERITVEEASRDWLALMPNEILPSDHLPIVWDFCLREVIKCSVPVLKDTAWTIVTDLLKCVLKPKLQEEWEKKKEGVFQVDMDGWRKKADEFFGEVRAELADEQGLHSRALPLLDMAYSMLCLAALEECKGGVLTKDKQDKDKQDLAQRSLSGVLKCFYIFSDSTRTAQKTQTQTQLEKRRLATVCGLAAHAAQTLFELSSEFQEVAETFDKYNKKLVSKIEDFIDKSTLDSETAVSGAMRHLSLRAHSSSDAQEAPTSHVEHLSYFVPQIVTTLRRSGEVEDCSALDRLMFEVSWALQLQDEALKLSAILALASVNWASGKFSGVQVRLATELCFIASKNAKAAKAEESEMLAKTVSREVSHFELKALVHDAVLLALKFIGASPNFNTGGAMEYIFDVMNRVDRQADPSHALWLRDALLVALRYAPAEKLLVKVQRVDLKSDCAVKEISAADELIALCKPFNVGEKYREIEARSMAYALKTMIRLSTVDEDQQLSFTGPHAFLAPMVQDDGVKALREILSYTDKLEDTSLHKWRARARVAEFLVKLIQKDEENPLLRAFQQHIRDSIKNETFEGLRRMPTDATINDSEFSLDLQSHLGTLEYNLKVLFPEQSGITETSDLSDKYGTNEGIDFGGTIRLCSALT